MIENDPDSHIIYCIAIMSKKVVILLAIWIIWKMFNQIIKKGDVLNYK